MKIYGYARISRPTQKIERQIQNILKEYPTAEIFQEAYTGRKIVGRKRFNDLLNEIENGDTIVFDSVSRMSRNADEGIKLYFDLFDKGVNLIFLKERYIDTEVYKNNLEDKIKLTGTDEDEIFKGLNNYFRKLAQKQIRIAFEQAQKEVDDLRIRTSEGIREAKRRGCQIGQRPGNILKIKKAEPIKKIIKEYSKDFNGTLDDSKVMAIINNTKHSFERDQEDKVLHISRNTYYKYKRELVVSLQKETE